MASRFINFGYNTSKYYHVSVHKDFFKDALVLRKRKNMFSVLEYHNEKLITVDGN